MHCVHAVCTRHRLFAADDLQQTPRHITVELHAGGRRPGTKYLLSAALQNEFHFWEIDNISRRAGDEEGLMMHRMVLSAPSNDENNHGDPAVITTVTL